MICTCLFLVRKYEKYSRPFPKIVRPGEQLPFQPQPGPNLNSPKLNYRELGLFLVFITDLVNICFSRDWEIYRSRSHWSFGVSYSWIRFRRGIEEGVLDKRDFGTILEEGRRVSLIVLNFSYYCLLLGKMFLNEIRGRNFTQKLDHVIFTEMKKPLSSFWKTCQRCL